MKEEPVSSCLISILVILFIGMIGTISYCAWAAYQQL